jgi:hypothetical protein
LGAFSDILPRSGVVDHPVMVIVCKARFRRLSPPRLSLCRTVLPLEAGQGFTPASEAKAASLRTLPGCDQAVMTVATATAPVPTISNSGAADFAGSALSCPSGSLPAERLLRKHGAPTELLPRALLTVPSAPVVPAI